MPTTKRWLNILLSLFFSSLSLLFFIFPTNAYSTASPKPNALVLTIQEAIGPATAEYILHGLEAANTTKASVVILQIDTPGGLDTSMRDIIRNIIASPIPVVVYVAPSGARAASAGTYILYAAHIAAMAPGTNVGAATPVNLAALGEKVKEKTPAAPTVEERKVTNDALAYLRTLAAMHNRNIPWATKAITESASLSAPEALKLGVIEVIATDIPDLLQKIDGKTVLVQGKPHVIHSQNLSAHSLNADWRIRFLSTITNPNIAYILLLVGIYGLFFEFFNPGFILPGVAGVIALLVALYAFQLLPVHYSGLALLLFGIAFLVTEAFVPSGVLAIGGLIAFVFGSIMLFDTHAPEFQIALSVILAITTITAIFFLVIIQMAIRSRLKPVVSGADQYIGKQGEIIHIEPEQILMRIASETWQVKSNQSLQIGEMVTVIKRDGLILWVESNSKKK